MKSTDHDVIIVGASIAGCAAAILCARSGARVALVERNPDPRAHKVVCTTYIQPSAVPVLERLGLVERIEAAGGVRNSIDVWTRWGWIRGSEAGTRHGYNIRRAKLDPMLREHAAQTPGVELMLGQTVQSLRRDGSRVTGVGLRGTGGDERALAARVVIGADGRASRVAELAGVPGRRRAHGRFAYMASYRELPLATGTRSQMWLLEPDAAFAFAHDDGITVLGCMPAHERRAAFRDDPVAALERMFDGLPAAPPVAGATRVSKAIGKIDMTNVSRPAALPGLAFVGDAAMASDPLWGVGVGFALQSAELLADTAAEAIAAGRGIDRALRRYGRAHRRMLAGHHWQTTDFSTGRAYNPVERLMFSAAARDAASAARFHAFGAREISFARYVAPAALARAAAVNLQWRRGPAPTALQAEGA